VRAWGTAKGCLLPELPHSEGVIENKNQCLMSTLFDGICIQIRVPSTTLDKTMEVFTFLASACNNKKEKCGKQWKHLFCQNPHQWSGGWGQRVLMFSLCACLSRIYNLHVQVSIVICQLKSYVLLCWQVWTFYQCNLL
jgi:hypothetical protein